MTARRQAGALPGRRPFSAGVKATQAEPAVRDEGAAGVVGALVPHAAVGDVAAPLDLGEEALAVLGADLAERPADPGHEVVDQALAARPEDALERGDALAELVELLRAPVGLAAWRGRPARPATSRSEHSS